MKKKKSNVTVLDKVLHFAKILLYALVSETFVLFVWNAPKKCAYDPPLPYVISQSYLT